MVAPLFPGIAYLLVVACSPARESTDDSGPRGALPDTGTPSDTSEPDDTVPAWPEDTGTPAAQSALSLVLDGALAADGDRRAYTAGPARSSGGFVVDGVVVNRGADTVALDTVPWIDAPGWTFARSPAASLAPGASTDFALAYTPAAERGAVVREDLLRVGEDGPVVTLEVTVPRPNRAVMTGDGGWWATSDDGGATWTQGGGASPVETRERSVIWGEGRFFRAWADGMGWSVDGRYAWSEDGQTWQDSVVADDFWASSCAFGLGRFACVRGDVLTWSDTGASVIHEATHWQNMLNAVAFTGDSLVAVGRGGRRVVSHDATTWDVDASSTSATDELRDVTCVGTTCVAVGGANRYLVARSDDGGVTWSEQVWPTSQYAVLTSVVWTGSFWLASGISNDDPRLLVSTDGWTWAGLPGVSRSTGYNLLGVVDGIVFGERSGAVHRSENGAAWTEVLTAPAGVTPRRLAVEAR